MSNMAVISTIVIYETRKMGAGKGRGYNLCRINL